MKKIYSFVLGIIFTGAAFAQGTITGFTIDPVAPTTASFVKVYASVQFGSMGCDVDNQGHSTSGSSSSGYAHHCLGMASAICNAIDTFDLGFLPVGSHLFSMTLTSGFGGAGCTAGIVPDDNSNTNFIVTLATGIADFNSTDLTFFPNPMHTSATIQINPLFKLTHAELRVVDVMGRTVKFIQDIQSNTLTIDRDQLSDGVYFYQLSQNKEILTKGKFVIE